MRVLIVCNSAAGKGRGPHLVDRAVTALTSARCSVSRLDVDRAHPAAFLERLHDATQIHDLCLIAGGDGTVHFSLPALLHTSCALYHLPLGTENLFSREFAMHARVDALMKAIRRDQRIAIDVGTLTRENAPTRHFAIMCSVGPDAGVIHTLSERRTGAISHLSYTMPVLRELTRPRVATLTVHVDDRPLVTARTGMLVIANMRQYALRIDHAHRASACDGLLDVVFMPASSALEALLWTLRSRLRERHDTDGSLYATAARVRVSSDDARSVFQIDGEPGGHASQGALTFGLLPRALTVLDAREHAP